jgi:hypothetical protein
MKQIEYDDALLVAIDEALKNGIKNGYGDEDKNMSDGDLANELFNLDWSVEQRIMAILTEHVKKARSKYHA